MDGKIADMKANNIKYTLLGGIYLFRDLEIAKDIYMEAWVDLNHMNICHSINGEVMGLVFPTLDAFCKHIEKISEPENIDP